MKKLLTIFCLVLLVSCSPPLEVPTNQLVERQGITYQVNSEKPFTGTSVEYYLDTIIKDQFEERVLWKRTTYKDGWLNGLSESFHPNGQLAIRENYKDGEPQGLQEMFYENGQLELTGTFFKGKEEGSFELFYENGKLKERHTYKDGERDGLLEYYENDNLTAKGNFNNGKMEGSWESYNIDNGQLTSRKNYKDGELDGLMELFNENGQVMSKINYKNGEQQGLREDFDEYGNKKPDGEELVQSLGCIACHSINGDDGIGPTFQNSFGSTRYLGQRPFIVTVDEKYIKQSILNPDEKIPEGYAPVMPSYNLNDAELNLIIEFIQTLTDSRIIGEEVSELTNNTPLTVTQLTGEEVYYSACFACHMTGAGGAPLLSDARSWEARVKQGVSILVQRSIDGYIGEIGIMPAKGGRLDLSDEEVEAAVIYMLDQL